MNIQKKKGFTLIELLIVIAIIAILGSATVLVLNPVELMAQSRDGTRVSDLATLRNAVNTYVVNTTVTSNIFGSCPAGGRCNLAIAAGSGPFNSAGACAGVASTVITGAGWVDINFTSVTGSAPALSALPVDPKNTGTNVYGYACNNTANTYEFATKLESTKYAAKMTSDGGASAAWYEIGTDPGLDL